jgi:hypothetical protein
VERGNILVVAVVTAAVALFALARFSPSPSDSRTDVSDDARYGDGSAESARVGGADRSYAGGGGAGSEEGRKPALGSLGERRPGGVGREPMHLAKQTGPTGRRSESAVSILGKERERGKVGVSGSQREISSGGSGVTINESGRPSNLGDVGSSRTERRSNLVDFLAEQPLGTNSVLEDDVSKDPDEENTDVVLSVPLDRESGTVANDDTPPLVEHELEFGEDGVGMKFDAGSVLAFPDAGNVRGDAGSLALEFQPEWSGAEKGDYSLVNVRTPNDPTNSLRLFKNGRYLRLLFADNTGRERNIGYDMVDWEPGELHTVAATWDQGALSLYVDNQLVGTNYYEGQLEIRPGTPLYLGSDVPEAPLSGANATISNFRVYGRALSNDEVLNYRFPTDEN